MKRKLLILSTLILAAMAASTAVSCIRDSDFQRPVSDDVSVHFRIRTPMPAQVGTRAATIEGAVHKVALLVFQQEGGAGEFLYRYTAMGETITQEEDTEADFVATLRASGEPVKLLAIANYPDGLLDDVAANDTEAEVRHALTGNVNTQVGMMPMSGVKELAGISTGMGSIRIPMLRSMAKVTIGKDEAVVNFTMTNISIYRMINEFQFFAAPGAVMNEDGAEGTPVATTASVPEETTFWNSYPPTNAGVDQSYYNFMNESAANDVADEATCIVVGGKYNGSETVTYYRLDFDTDNDAPIINPMGQVLRNFWYQFTITAVNGPGWENPDDAANNLGTDMVATVLPWNGGDNSPYHFGKDRYVILSKPELMLGVSIGDSDELYITTSGVPFTVTSQSDPAAGMMGTADGESKGIYTDIMNILIGEVGGAEPGQQRWLLKAYAETTDLIDDVLNLSVLGGATTIRIPIRRNVDFSVERIGELETVPNTGTPDKTTGDYSHYVEYQINIPESMTWSATITDQGWVSGSTIPPHPAYLLDSATGQPVGTTISGQSGTATLWVGFDQLFYPTTKESPKATITISVDGMPSLTQVVSVVQDPLPVPSLSLDFLDVYNSTYTSLTPTGLYISSWADYLKSPALFGTASTWVQASAPINIVGMGTSASSVPTAIDPRYRYLHLGGTYPTPTTYSQERHDVVNAYWQRYGNDRVFVYAYDVRNDAIFANATVNGNRRTTILTLLNINYLEPESIGNTMKITTRPQDRSTLLYRYLTQDGPFGAVTDTTEPEYYTDIISSGVDPASLPETAVPLIFDDEGIAVACFIDPANGLVFFGDSQMFDDGIPAFSTIANATAGNTDDHSRFLLNILAYVVNCAQYGSGFADLFLPGNEALYEAAFPPAP